jgi:hypothetical protein
MRLVYALLHDVAIYHVGFVCPAELEGETPSSSQQGNFTGRKDHAFIGGSHSRQLADDTLRVHGALKAHDDRDVIPPFLCGWWLFVLYFVREQLFSQANRRQKIKAMANAEQLEEKKVFNGGNCYGS